MTDKPQKLRDETFEHDGHTVLFREIPRVEDRGYKEERRRFEVLVDGDFVAIARMPYGFGKQAIRLDRLIDNYYSSVFGHADSSSWLAAKKFTLEDLVPFIVDARFQKSNFNRLATREEIAAAHAVAKARKDEEDREQEDRYRRERKQTRTKLEAEIADLDAELEALRELIAGDLSNLQRAALIRSETLLQRLLSDRKHSLYIVTERMERNGET